MRKLPARSRGGVQRTEEYNEMKEIYRYRVDPQSKIFAIDVESSGKNRAGFIASIGDSIVSSSTWKCKNRYINDNVTELVQPIISDSNWGKAVEWRRRAKGGVGGG